MAIRIQNIYYMLVYAFQVLNEQGYRDVAAEPFHNAAEFCAAILSKGVSMQLKRGLDREYISKTETLSGLRGKPVITESIQKQTMLRKQMVCIYDTFSVNTERNRIIKTTMLRLMHADIGKVRKKELRRLLVFFDEVEELEIHSINWRMQYSRKNQTYRMLVSVCYLVLKGLLQTTADGSTKLMDFVDEQRMCRLYEKFILEFYRREYPMLTVNASRIPWGLEDGVDDMLPVMQTDIMLSRGSTVLIIDAKYYSQTTQMKFDVHTVHSNHIYQIFAYVKNKEFQMKDPSSKVSGMLLYAGTEEEIQPNQRYQMSGNKISVRTLDLNQRFYEIAAALDAIAVEHFGEDVHREWKHSI